MDSTKRLGRCTLCESSKGISFTKVKISEFRNCFLVLHPSGNSSLLREIGYIRYPKETIEEILIICYVRTHFLTCVAEVSLMFNL
jgi:hypothetical protein